ncbi:Zn(II)2Cys6 transcription factor [Aspergillus foveolatus]|uniref:Zn(II)2Cys6 transcription factor n=1 Tax=Aspergillus foveolatus TaxID=210207 RepID=UPI003CCCF6EC
MPEPRRPRTGTKKSRTGCRACRARHIKCDETPSSCKNCTSTGRACDYDLQRLPRLGRVAAVRSGADNRQPFPPAISSCFPWAITTDEQRCFAHFRDHMVPTLSQFFDSSLWQDLVPQMSHLEPAVYHAVVALSAIHKDSDIHGPPLPGQNLQNDWHRFALEQCGRSFTLLSRRCSSQDPRFRDVMLLCCLLFVLMQLLRGQYDDAFQHLESGLRILHEAKDRGGCERFVHPCVVAAFVSLEVQSLQFGVHGALSIGYEVEQPTDRMAVHGGYPSLHEARQALDLLLGATFRFLGQCGELSEEEIYLDYGSMHHRQLWLLSRVTVFGNRLERFCLGSRLNQKERRGADLLRLVYQSLSLPIRTALIRNDATLDYYIPEYEAHLSAVEDFMNRHPGRPTVILDTGILPSLYYVAMSCRDDRIRHRAIATLRSWPHREGSPSWTA